MAQLPAILAPIIQNDDNVAGNLKTLLDYEMCGGSFHEAVEIREFHVINLPRQSAAETLLIRGGMALVKKKD